MKGPLPSLEDFGDHCQCSVFFFKVSLKQVGASVRHILQVRIFCFITWHLFKGQAGNYQPLAHVAGMEIYFR